MKGKIVLFMGVLFCAPLILSCDSEEDADYFENDKPKWSTTDSWQQTEETPEVALGIQEEANNVNAILLDKNCTFNKVCRWRETVS